MLYDIKTTSRRLNISPKTLSVYVNKGFIRYLEGNGRKKWFTDKLIEDFLSNTKHAESSRYFKKGITNLKKCQPYVKTFWV